MTSVETVSPTFRSHREVKGYLMSDEAYTVSEVCGSSRFVSASFVEENEWYPPCQLVASSGLLGTLVPSLREEAREVTRESWSSKIELSGTPIERPSTRLRAETKSIEGTEVLM
jgi:hypothetical protein